MYQSETRQTRSLILVDTALDSLFSWLKYARFYKLLIELTDHDVLCLFDSASIIGGEGRVTEIEARTKHQTIIVNI